MVRKDLQGRWKVHLKHKNGGAGIGVYVRVPSEGSGTCPGPLRRWWNLESGARLPGPRLHVLTAILTNTDLSPTRPAPPTFMLMRD